MPPALLRALRRRLAAEGGFTLSEMLVVLAILGIVLSALTQLFISGSNAQIDITNRFRAQQNARLALDALRREIHCANSVTSMPTAGLYPTASIKINLGAYCPLAPSGGGDVTWCTIGSSQRYALWRTPGATCTATGGIQKADYLTSAAVFTAYNTAGSGVRATLSIDLPVDITPATTTGRYELKDDIVLRNTSR